MSGMHLYETNCVRCHEGNDPDGPTLFGRTFIERWREDTLEPLFDHIHDRMPADEPGKLTPAAALDILTFLLESNSYPHGSTPLTIETLPQIRLVGPEGPRPLPANTLVQVVGCMTQASAEDWNLTRGSDPVRSRQGKESSPEELKKAAATPLGNSTFVLQNFNNIAFGYKPDPLKGHKVQAKGVLIRQGSSERISLTSLESLATTCGS